jgi:hypothetical protein
MKNELIIKRYKGDSFRIIAEIIPEFPYYEITVLRQFRNGKSWYPLPDALETSEYRSFSADQKRAHNIKIALKFVTGEEIAELLSDFHEKLKPDFKKLNIPQTNDTLS